jgi:hypothetical protein
MSVDLYPTSTTFAGTDSTFSTSLWPVTGSGAEIDLREEFRRFLFGASDEIAKGRLGILRQPKYESSGEPNVCPCVSETTGEPDRDTYCPYCRGYGYIFREQWVVYYKLVVASNEGVTRRQANYKGGLVDVPLVFFYVQYHVEPKSIDQFIEVELDVDGNVAVPVVRKAIYELSTAQAFRSDRGRVEYWRLAATEDSVKANWE